MNFSKIRTKLLIVCGLCIALAATGITYALLTTKSDTNENAFSGANAKVNISVVEEGKAGEFEDAPGNTVIYDTIEKDKTIGKVVQIKNKENSANAYIRVKLNPVFVNDENPDEMLGKKVEVTFNFAKESKWKLEESTNTYYFTESVPGDGLTGVLLESVTLNEDQPEGYHLEVQVLADAVSADSITEAWKTDAETINNYKAL